MELLEQEGRGLRLTEAGERFKAYAQPLLTQWQELPARLRDNTRKSVTRLGSFEVFTTYFLGSWMRTLRKTHWRCMNLGQVNWKMLSKTVALISVLLICLSRETELSS